MNVKPRLALIARTFLLMMVLLCTGCASLQGTMTERIQGRQLEYAWADHDTDTVVFENGLGGTLDWWAKVYPELAKDTSVFAYNRPGYGHSEPVATPRDGAHIVDELRALLQSKGIKPPYVLVGHSLGGLYMQLFARRYPDEVSGLVLVDSTHPAQAKGQGSPENWPAWFRAMFKLTASTAMKQELQALDATGDEVLALPSFTGKPVIVLSALQPMKVSSPLADDSNAKRKDLVRLYPGAQQIWVDSGHGIPLEQPEVVLSAIREVLAHTRPQPR
jgi:pimeloyl-ACP methyl ester carboxylesterase